MEVGLSSMQNDILFGSQKEVTIQYSRDKKGAYYE